MSDPAGDAAYGHDSSVQEPDFESVVLRESVRARVSVAAVSILGTYLSLALFLPFLLNQGVSATRIFAWATPIVLLILARTLYSRAIQRRLDQLADRDLRRIDTRLRISSVANQFSVGVGIWVIQSPSADPYVLPLFMTLVVLIFCVGVMANLFSDFRSFLLSVPLLIGQPAIYWLTRDEIGVGIGIGMLLATSLMILLVRRGSEIFRDSVLMRFEKDGLLQRLEEETSNTREALKQAEQANRSKAFLMAAASHDIKQPLGTLGVMTESLLISDVTGPRRAVLEKLRGSIASMSRHFDALMDMGRFEGGTMVPRPERLRLRDLASRIDEEFAPLCLNKGLDWTLRMDDVELETDVELLFRLFRNLLNNAIDYTEAGSVRCVAETVDHRVEFSIADTGPGIPLAEQGHVFEQFVRLDSTRTGLSGAGLGLAIVSHIDSVLDLNLHMASSEGRGTRFTFSIPIAGQQPA